MSRAAKAIISQTTCLGAAGLKGNRLQSLAGPYFVAFLANRITIGPQNRQNLFLPSHFFASILQVRQARG